MNLKDDQKKAGLKGKSMELYHELGSLTEAEKIRAAKVLQKVWQTIGEWEGKISDKQVKKVAVIKKILSKGCIL